MPLHVRLLLVDDHPFTRTALATSLRTDPRLDVVADAGTPDEALALARTHRPDAVVIDLGDQAAVLRTVRSLREAVPDTHLLLLGTSADPGVRLRLLDLGVRAYLDKGVTLDILRSAIVLLMDAEQELVISVSQPPSPPLPGTAVAAPLVSAPPSGTLSEREAEVVRCVAAALSNRQIASSLGITEGTVKRHLRNIFAKLGAVSRLDAVNRAMALGLLAAQADIHRAHRDGVPVAARPPGSSGTHALDLPGPPRLRPRPWPVSPPAVRAEVGPPARRDRWAAESAGATPAHTWRGRTPGRSL